MDLKVGVWNPPSGIPPGFARSERSTGEWIWRWVSGIPHARSKPAPLVLNGTLKELEGQNVSGYSGKLKSLGQVVANVDTQTGNASETKIVVTGAKGSVTLSYNSNLISDQVGRNSEILAFPYTVVSGTGAYMGAKGSGLLEETDQSYHVFSFISPSLMTTFSLHTIRSA